MGIETAIILGSLAIAGATVGTSAYGSSQENKRQKKILNAQEEQVRAAEDKARGAEALVAQDAADKIKKQRLRQTQTILTSPLGIQEDAEVGTKTLLGG